MAIGNGTEVRRRRGSRDRAVQVVENKFPDKEIRAVDGRFSKFVYPHRCEMKSIKQDILSCLL